MKNYGKVKVFAGDIDEILSMYNALNGEVGVDIYCHGKTAELKVMLNDYVKAVGLGSRFATRNGFNKIVWFMPNGQGSMKFGETAVKANRGLNNGSMVAFSGTRAIEIAGLSAYLNSNGIYNTNIVDEKSGNWQVVVKPEDYMNAVGVGAKYVDGHNFRQVVYFDPTGSIMFDMNKLAQTARTELDEVLEA